MGLTEEQIGVKMRLQGASTYQAGMDKSAASTAAYGNAAEKAGVQARDASGRFTGMGRSASKSSGVGISAMQKMKKVGEGLKSTGSTLTRSFTLPIALLGGVGVKSALDFSDAMNQISTQAGASQGEVDRMTKSVMAFARSGKSSEGPNTLAEGLFSIESAGFRGKRAFDAMVKSEQLATVGHADFGKTSKAVAAAMATQIKGTKNLGETVGLMNSIVGIGSMRMEDLLSAMGTGLLDKSAAIGLSLREVGAGLGVLTTTGTPAAAASTRMAMAFSMMAAPTEKAAQAMESIGLTESQLALGMRKKGLVPTIELLKKKLSDTFGNSKQGLVEQSKAVSEMFGGGRTSGGIISLMRHVDLLKSKYGELGGAQGKFKQALKNTEAQPIEKLHVAWAQAQVALIELGNILIPFLTKAVKFFSGLISGFSHLSPSAKKLIVILLVGLAVMGPLLSMFGSMVIGITALAGILTGVSGLVILTIAAVLAFGIAFYVAYHKIKPFHDAVDSLVHLFGGWANAAAFVLVHLSPIGAVALLVAGHIKWVSNAVQNAIRFFQALPQRAMAALAAFPGFIKANIGKIISFFLLLPIRIPVIITQLGIAGVRALIGIAPSMWQAAAHIASTIAKGVASKASALWGWVKTLPGKFLSAVTSIASQLISVGGEIAKQIANGLKNELLSILPGPVKDALEGAAGVAGDVGGFLTGGFASGTTSAPGGIALVGERGPELVNLPRGSEVITASRTKAIETNVRPLRTRGGPTPERLETARVRGAGGRSKGTPVEVTAVFQVGRRKFGEAMAMAMIEEEENE